MAYRSSSSTSFTGTTNLTATAPPGYQANDRLYAFVVQDAVAATFTPPANWVSLGEANNPSGQPNEQKAQLFELKNATGSDSFAFISDSTVPAIIQVAAFSGRDNVLAAVVSSTVNTASNASPVAVNLSGVVANSGDDVAFFAQLDLTVALATWGFASPAGYTEREDTSNNDWITSTVATRDNVTTGATGVLAATATRLTGTGNAGYSGFVVVVPVTPAPVEYVYRPPFDQQAGFSGQRRVLGMLALAKNANAQTFFNSLLFQPAAAGGVGFTGTSQTTAKNESAVAKTGQSVGSSRATARSSSTAQKLVAYSASQLAVAKDAAQTNKRGSAAATTQTVAKDQNAAQKVIVTSFTGDFLSVAKSNSSAAKLGVGVASQLATVKDQAASNKRGSAVAVSQAAVKNQGTANKRGSATGTSQSAVKGQGTANKRGSSTGTAQTVAKEQSTAQKVVAGSFTGDSLTVAKSNSAAAKRGTGVASQLATVKDQAASNKRGSAVAVSQAAVKDQGTANKRGSATGTAQTVAKDQSTAQKIVAASFTGDSLSVARSQSASAKRGIGAASQYLHVLHRAVTTGNAQVAVPDWSRYLFEITAQEYSFEICAQCYELELDDKAMHIEFYL